MMSLEFKQWKIYNRINPIGPRRTDLGFAVLAAEIVNSRRSKASDPLADWRDFMPKFYEAPAAERRKMENSISEFMVGFGAPPTPDDDNRGSAKLRKR
jgi:hypothetical protein